MGDLEHNHPNTRAAHHGTDKDHEPEEKRRVGVGHRGGRKETKGKEGVVEGNPAVVEADGEESDLTEEDEEDMFSGRGRGG